MAKKLIGFQLANGSGQNIQGEPDEDPTPLATYEVMDTALAVFIISKYPGYLLVPIFAGDVENPVILSPTDMKIIRPNAK